MLLITPGHYIVIIAHPPSHRKTYLSLLPLFQLTEMVRRKAKPDLWNRAGGAANLIKEFYLQNLHRGTIDSTSPVWSSVAINIFGMENPSILVWLRMVWLRDQRGVLRVQYLQGMMPNLISVVNTFVANGTVLSSWLCSKPLHPLEYTKLNVSKCITFHNYKSLVSISCRIQRGI